LRQTLVRKLTHRGGREPAADRVAEGREAASGSIPLTKQIDYAAVVRRVRWRGVFSRFEANFTYLENARVRMPGSYRPLIRHWRAGWVSVNLADAHPRFVASDRPSGAGRSFGPFPTPRAARQQIDMLEDLFDLCREHAILVQAPHGSACAYKQMGRCPAPCDGSVTMDDYRRQIGRACEYLTQPRQRWADELTRQMQSAAAELNFELAGRIKRQVEAVRASAESGADRLIAPLEAFAFLSVQRGAKKGSVRLFVVLPGVIEPLGEFGPKDLAAQLETVLPRVQQAATTPSTAPQSAAESERIALAGWSLYSNPQRRGVFLRLGEIHDVAPLVRAADRLRGDTESHLSEADAVGEQRQVTAEGEGEVIHR
jgi:hypothetical protein